MRIVLHVSSMQFSFDALVLAAFSDLAGGSGNGSSRCKADDGTNRTQDQRSDDKARNATDGHAGPATAASAEFLVQGIFQKYRSLRRLQVLGRWLVDDDLLLVLVSVG